MTTVPAIEAVYRRSKFVAEIAVLRLASGSLVGLVVPNMPLMRERRIANIGDLLRFEIEGQSIDLPPHERIVSYEVSFNPLPRTRTGELDRSAIELHVVEKRRPIEAGSDLLAQSPLESAALAVIARRAPGRTIRAESNLEIDLGLDSLDRVELLFELEQAGCGRIEEKRAHEILTVVQLLTNLRRPATSTADPSAGEPRDDWWPAILRDLPPKNDPVLGPLLKKRRVVPAAIFILLRVARWLMPRVLVTGVEHLPRSGPFIISPNHQSYLDPLVLASVLPYRVLESVFVVGAAEYFETPLTAWVARQCHLVPVDPDAFLVPALQAGAFGLTHGQILLLFPEGERSIDRTVKRFKKGGPILARVLGVPIVPVAIRGVYEVWPRNRRFSWRALLPWSGHHVRIAFGPPLSMGNRTAAEGAAALQRHVAELWDGLDDSPERRESQSGGHTAGKQNR